MKTYSVKLTAAQWGRICAALMQAPETSKNGITNNDCHNAIFDQLPYTKNRVQSCS